MIEIIGLLTQQLLIVIKEVSVILIAASYTVMYLSNVQLKAKEEHNKSTRIVLYLCIGLTIVTTVYILAIEKYVGGAQ